MCSMSSSKLNEALLYLPAIDTRVKDDRPLTNTNTEQLDLNLGFFHDTKV